MKLQVIAKNNIEVSQTLKAYVEKKISKLSRYLPNLSSDSLSRLRWRVEA